MKTILFLMTILFFSPSCTKQEMEFNSDQPVTSKPGNDFVTEINKAYIQSWVSGVRGGGAGTDFYIEFVQQLPKEITLGDLHFRNRKAPVMAISDVVYQSRFLRNEINPGDDISGYSADSRTAITPFSIKDDEALLEYYENGALKYYLITNVQEAQSDFYPD